MNERQKSIVTALGQSSVWQAFRDEYLRDYIRSVRDVSNNMENEELYQMTLKDPSAAFMGKLIAGIALEDLIKIVDNLGTTRKESEKYN